MVATRGTDRRGLAVAAAIVLAVVAVYANSLDVPFVFDDTPAIVDNPTIRRLWPLTEVLLPPRGEGVTVEGRPVLNLTLALNHAIDGTRVRGYHLFNIGVHVLATLTLFGVVRRTLTLPRLESRFGEHALAMAGIIAALWGLHPLQTESVTYVVQRAEAMVGLFYLLTLYCFIRAATTGDHAIAGPRPRIGWSLLSVAACAVGMATKEVMVSAPLVVLVFDRTFLAGTFREVWRTRGRLHLGLFATWILLAVLVASAGTRGGTAGFGINVSPFAYALTQFEAITRYLVLSVWPHPLVFDYGVAWITHARQLVPYAFLPIALVAATIVAWRRKPEAAWLALLFFAVLSPTSSIVPGNRQTIAEHRMYLPLAAVIVFLVCSVVACASRHLTRYLCLAGMLSAVAFGTLTLRRNADYQSEIVLYRDTAAKRPGNGFVRYNLGKALAEAGQHAAAIPEYEAALPLMAHAPGVQYNLANSLAALGRNEEAIRHYEAALRAAPDYARAHFNLANVLVTSGRKGDAVTHYTAALAAEPGLIEARVNLGAVLLELGRLDQARRELETVLATEPRHVLALFNLGNVYLLEQRWEDASRCFAAVLAEQPDLAAARERLMLARQRRGP